MMKRFAFSLLLVLPAAPLTQAADCTTAFDQSCLPGEYTAEAVEANHQWREEQLLEFQRAVEAQEHRQAQEEAQEAERQRAAESAAAQHQEQVRAQPPPTIVIIRRR